MILPLASFMLALYVSFRLKQFFTVMDMCWHTEGRIQDLALIYGSLLIPHRKDPLVQEVLWTVYRYLNLVHVYMYARLSARIQTAAHSGNLVQAGLLLDNEEYMLGE